MDVVELFSGIGAQAKALERANIDHNILATCDWDINAIIAYDIIHHGPQGENEYCHLTREELNRLILELNISSNGKKPMTNAAKIRMPRITKEKLLYAINRSNNLLDITRIGGADLPDHIDLLTYSFPCQDLSLAGNWHYNEGGIDRNSGNRSSLLWEVERILQERELNQMNLPRFLLMENVTAILNERHRNNFNEWKTNLENLGYQNCVLTLDARNFGVPQMRNRTYMISVYTRDCNPNDRNMIRDQIQNLEDGNILLEALFPRERFHLIDVLKEDYRNLDYLSEALESNPNRTVSREEIAKRNIFIDENTEYVPTITTKQDRHPNSGLIRFDIHENSKMDFRYLTPRECFLIMGFDENDFQILCDNNFSVARNRKFFTRDKLNRMAGNSICVNVLESIFEFINNINNDFFI